jgi:hypothetical protein
MICAKRCEPPPGEGESDGPHPTADARRAPGRTGLTTRSCPQPPEASLGHLCCARQPGTRHVPPGRPRTREATDLAHGRPRTFCQESRSAHRPAATRAGAARRRSREGQGPGVFRRAAGTAGPADTVAPVRRPAPRGRRTQRPTSRPDMIRGSRVRGTPGHPTSDIEGRPLERLPRIPTEAFSHRRMFHE